jgi:hypothetical protein
MLLSPVAAMSFVKNRSSQPAHQRAVDIHHLIATRWAAHQVATSVHRTGLAGSLLSSFEIVPAQWASQDN